MKEKTDNDRDDPVHEAVSHLSGHDNLYGRINKVKEDIVRIPKTGKNAHFGFAFATESDVSDVLRPLMAKHGVCLLYHGPDWDKLLIVESKTGSGHVQWLYRVWVHYELVNVFNPLERETVWAPGEALDGQDKGMSKAITAAAKYAWLKIFDISTGDQMDEPDAHGSNESINNRTPNRPNQIQHPARPTTPPPPRNPSQPAGSEGCIGPLAFSRIREKAGTLGVTKNNIIAHLRANGHDSDIRGLWEKMPLWPAKVIPAIEEFFASKETSLAQKSDDEQSPYSDMDMLLEEVQKLWPIKMQNIKSKPNEPANPTAMTMEMVKLNPNLSPKELLQELENDCILFPSGNTIPF